MRGIKTMDFTPKAKLSLHPSHIFLNITGCIHPYLNRNFLPPTQPLAVITSAYLSFWDSHEFLISLLEKINIESNYWESQGGPKYLLKCYLFFFGLLLLSKYTGWASKGRDMRKENCLTKAPRMKLRTARLSLSLRTEVADTGINMLQANSSTLPYSCPVFIILLSWVLISQRANPKPLKCWLFTNSFLFCVERGRLNYLKMCGVANIPGS